MTRYVFIQERDGIKREDTTRSNESAGLVVTVKQVVKGMPLTVYHEDNTVFFKTSKIEDYSRQWMQGRALIVRTVDNFTYSFIKDNNE